MLILEVMNSPLKGRTVKLNDGLSIGTGEGCSIRAKHKDLLPVHARFRVSEGLAHVEVGDQQAHIFVNGKDVMRSDLRHNDTIAVGPLRFKVVDKSLVTQTANRLDNLLEGLDDGPGEIYDFATEDIFYLINKDPSLRQAIAFKIPSKDRFIDQAQQFLARLVRQSDTDEFKVEAFMTCAKELILNAHRHGHEYDESKTIVVRYADLGDRLRLIIEDEGTGFDHRALLAEVEGLSAAEAARKRYQAGGFGGLGFQMITRMAESLEYNDAGNVVTIVITKQMPG